MEQKLSLLNPQISKEEQENTLNNSQFSSVQFSCSVVSDSLRPHESQHARPPCPSPTPGVLYEIRNQLQEKKNKTEHKHMVMKQYITKQPMNHGRNKRRNKRNKMYLGTNENESTMIQNLWDVAKAVLKEKFTAIQSYL